MNFCILFGGKSYEHEISIVSAIAIRKLFPQLKHFVFLDSSHNFYLIPAQKMQSKFFSSKDYIKEQKIYPQKDGFCMRTFFGEKPLHFPILINLIHV